MLGSYTTSNIHSSENCYLGHPSSHVERELRFRVVYRWAGMLCSINSPHFKIMNESTIAVDHPTLGIRSTLRASAHYPLNSHPTYWSSQRVYISERSGHCKSPSATSSRVVRCSRARYLRESLPNCFVKFRDDDSRYLIGWDKIWWFETSKYFERSEKLSVRSMYTWPHGNLSLIQLTLGIFCF